MCKQLFLCDKINRRCKFIETLFRDFLTFYRNTERKRKILKDEKKYHVAVDKSSSEEQFCKSDAITFVM